MAFQFWSTAAAGRPGQIDTAPQNELGTEARDNEGNVWKYLRGAANVAANNVVTFDSAFLVTRGGASSVGPIAIASAAIIADRWGWFGVKGTFTVTSATDIGDSGSKVGVIASGAVDDAWSSGFQILGARNVGHTGSNAFCTCQIDYPFVGVTGTGTA